MRTPLTPEQKAERARRRAAEWYRVHTQTPEGIAKIRQAARGRLAAKTPEELQRIREQKQASERKRAAKRNAKKREARHALAAAEGRECRPGPRTKPRPPEQMAARRKWKRDHWHAMTDEERAAYNQARKRRRARPDSPHRATEAARMREVRANMTDAEREREREYSHDYEKNRRVRTREQRDQWNAVRRERRRAAKSAPPAPSIVPDLTPAPMTKEVRIALRVRAKRRALAESIRSTSKGPTAEQDRRNLEWAQGEARRIDKEERQRNPAVR